MSSPLFRIASGSNDKGSLYALMVMASRRLVNKFKVLPSNAVKEICDLILDPPLGVCLLVLCL